MTWTVQVTDIEKAHSKTAFGDGWMVRYNMLDGLYPHLLGATFMVFAKDEIGVFYEFNKTIENWTKQGPLYGSEVNVTWFEKEEVQ
jgi:hypothetical protein